MNEIERLISTKDYLREQKDDDLKSCKFSETEPLIIDTYNANVKAFDIAIQALQEKRERDNPQPLTLEQLRQMDGQPVWCPTYGWGIVDTHFRKKKRISIVFARHWKIAQNVLLDGNEVYSNKPEESER